MARPKIEGKDEVYSGDLLMNAGILVQNPWGDFKGELFHLTQVE